MSSTIQRNPDGTWTEAEPLKGTRLYRAESWLRERGYDRLASALAWWDERWL